MIILSPSPNRKKIGTKKASKSSRVGNQPCFPISISTTKKPHLVFPYSVQFFLMARFPFIGQNLLTLPIESLFFFLHDWGSLQNSPIFLQKKKFIVVIPLTPLPFFLPLSVPCSKQFDLARSPPTFQTIKRCWLGRFSINFDVKSSSHPYSKKKKRAYFFLLLRVRDCCILR